jgi:hypothetical protein
MDRIDCFCGTFFFLPTTFHYFAPSFSRCISFTRGSLICDSNAAIVHPVQVRAVFLFCLLFFSSSFSFFLPLLPLLLATPVCFAVLLPSLLSSLLRIFCVCVRACVHWCACVRVYVCVCRRCNAPCPPVCSVQWAGT